MRRHCVYRVAVLLVLVLLQACAHFREISVPDVPDLGPQIQTKYRYKLIINERTFSSGYNVEPTADDSLKIFQPNVFDKTGVPIVLGEGSKIGTVSDQIIWPTTTLEKIFTLVYWFASVYTLPMTVTHGEQNVHETIKLFRVEEVRSTFSQYVRRDEIITMTSPIALLFYNGDPTPMELEQRRKFERHGWFIWSKVQQGKKSMQKAALAYAIAVRLKEMENTGEINEDVVRKSKLAFAQIEVARMTKEMQKRQKGRAIRPLSTVRKANSNESKDVTYTVARCEREFGRDFAYEFELQLSESGMTLSSMIDIQNQFRNYLLDIYSKTFPSVDMRTLVVDFTEYRQLGNSVEGSAVVLTIAPVSLTYDALTRSGKLVVRFSPGQEIESRSWARRNVEALARDKNIVLRTGEIPVGARFRTGDEKVNGDTFEIEFKTE